MILASAPVFLAVSRHGEKHPVRVDRLQNVF